MLPGPSAEPRNKPLANILLTSVIGPHGVDAADSRYKNPMCLMDNQVTRGQQHYSLQMFSPTFAYHLFGVNLAANVAVLDFPHAEQLVATLKAGRWDRVGLSGIMANFEKLLRTYELVRQVLPDVAIDVGGHIVNDDEPTRELIECMRRLCPRETFTIWESPREREPSSQLTAYLCEQKCQGGGVTFVKRDGLEYYAGLPGVGLKREDALFAPVIRTNFGIRVVGLPMRGIETGMLLPDVGCPMHCNFCTTSHKFGGKFVRFLETAEDILAVADANAAEGIDELTVQSENFFLDTERMRRLLRLMEEQHKPYRFDVFSSADALHRLGVETLVKLGLTFVWIGLEESTGTAYAHKQRGGDLRTLIAELQAHGIAVLGSTILGFEHHRPVDIDREIQHALSYGCAYNQFMLFMALPGTTLWREMKEKQRLKPAFPWADIHGQYVQNWQHPYVGDAQMEEKLDRAFEQEFEQLGPSVLRYMQIWYDGWKKTASFDHELVQRRRAASRKRFPGFIAALDAMSRDLRAMGNRTHEQARRLREELIEECGLTGRAAALIGGRGVSLALALEKRRLARLRQLRRAEEPGCLLTHYGTFTHRYPRIVPAPGRTPRAVAVSRRRAD
jgi:hypothetical protein